MEIWLATTNKGKIAEFKLLLQKGFPDCQIHSIEELKSYSQPPENGKTYLENARIKARSVKAMKPGTYVIAEDSGLEVEGLGNLPGIHTARYAGPKASDNENIAKLLKMMQIRPMNNRNARFVCSMVVYVPTGEEWTFEGDLKGAIAKAPAGKMGFGYDPVFVCEGQTQTLAELGPSFKQQHSHRAAATKAFIQKLKATL